MQRMSISRYYIGIGVDELRKVNFLIETVRVLMRFEPCTSQTQVHSITSSANLVIDWKRPLRSLGCKWEDNVTEVGCGCLYGNAQPQDQTVASFVHVVNTFSPAPI